MGKCDAVLLIIHLAIDGCRKEPKGKEVESLPIIGFSQWDPFGRSSCPNQVEIHIGQQLIGTLACSLSVMINRDGVDVSSFWHFVGTFLLYCFPSPGILPSEPGILVAMVGRQGQLSLIGKVSPNCEGRTNSE